MATHTVATVQSANQITEMVNSAVQLFTYIFIYSFVTYPLQTTVGVLDIFMRLVTCPAHSRKVTVMRHVRSKLDSY